MLEWTLIGDGVELIGDAAAQDTHVSARNPSNKPPVHQARAAWNCTAGLLWVSHLG